MDIVGETVEDESGTYEEKMKQLQGVFPTVSEGNLRKFLGFKDDVDRAISCLRGHIQFRTENVRFFLQSSLDSTNIEAQAPRCSLFW